MANVNIYTTGGTVQAGRGLYLERNADQELLQCCRDGIFTYILAPRQMGKSSLMTRTAQRLEEEDVKTVIISLDKIGTTETTAENWYYGVINQIALLLKLGVRSVDEWWHENDSLPITQRMTLFFEELLLKKVTERVVVFVDEIDTTLKLGFTDDFFIAVRALHNSRAQNPALERLSFVLIGVASPSDLIRDPNRTPFNIGTRIDMTDFTPEEALPLANGLEVAEEQAKQVIEWVLVWTGGHPYLTQKLCRIIAEKRQISWTKDEVDQVVAENFLGLRGEQDFNLQSVRKMLLEDNPKIAETLRVYEDIYNNILIKDYEQDYVRTHLKLSGLVKKYRRELVVRNLIYRTVFDKDWIKKNLPEDWNKLRQRANKVVIDPVSEDKNIPAEEAAREFKHEANQAQNNEIYLSRQADKELIELCRRGIFTHIVTPPQMGKTLLIKYAVMQLENEGIKAVRVNMDALGTDLSENQAYEVLALVLQSQLQLRTDVLDWWQEYKHLPATQRLILFFDEVVLTEIKTPLVIFFDEIKVLGRRNFRDDFLITLRSVYDARAHRIQLQRLCFVISATATIREFTSKIDYDLGHRLDLTEFTLEEAAPLAGKLGIEPEAEAQRILKWVMKQTEGHPYLTVRLCLAISKQDRKEWDNQNLESVLASTFLGVNREQDNHLKHIYQLLITHPLSSLSSVAVTELSQVLAVYREALAEEVVSETEQYFINNYLFPWGIVRWRSGRWTIQNNIYSRAFNVAWVRSQLPTPTPVTSDSGSGGGGMSGWRVAGILISITAAIIQLAIACTPQKVTYTYRVPNINELLYSDYTPYSSVPSLNSTVIPATATARAMKAETVTAEVRSAVTATAIAIEGKRQTYKRLVANTVQLGNAELNNDICRQGNASTADLALKACDRAAELAPDNGLYKSSRGIAQALNKNYEKAIDDFRSYIDWAHQRGLSNTNISKREGWINFLEKKVNPFYDKDISIADLEAILVPSYSSAIRDCLSEGLFAYCDIKKVIDEKGS